MGLTSLRMWVSTHLIIGIYPRDVDYRPGDRILASPRPMIIDKQILDELSAQAKANPRLRQAMDLRNSPEDLSQRMLNALEPGTVMPIHRHHASSETVVVLRGEIEWIFYDDEGNETERVVLDANGEPRMLNVERDRWHSLVCLERLTGVTYGVINRLRGRM